MLEHTHSSHMKHVLSNAFQIGVTWLKKNVVKTNL